MSVPPHHYMQNLGSAQQSAMNQGQFDPSPMQGQMGTGMQNQMNTPMIPQMGNPLINHPMNPYMGPGTQMLGQLNQQYAINPGNAMAVASALQLQQSPLEDSSNLQHHPMQQSQQQVMQQTHPTPPAQAQQQQSKEFNTASLCRIGQETIQDIVSRTQEVLQTLRNIQPPNGTPQSCNVSNEKKAKVQEQLRTIRVLFKRLRLIFDKCNENCQQGMEYTHIESLIPFKDVIDPKHDEKKNSEAYRLTCEESKEVIDQVVLKNKQLKDVTDHLRRIIWEINTMLIMRRS